MTTERQIEANQKNALISTGPVTGEGKSLVAQNAIKHGIFAKDLIISSGDGKEDAQEYKELLDGLIISLNPNGQMECLLVEKIAVDFWRLRRVLRFETGSIRQYLDMVIYDYYNKEDYKGKKENRTNAEIDEEIKELEENLDWNNRYIECLKKGIVKFDGPVWEGENIESNIEDDIFTIADRIKATIFQEEEFLKYERGELNWEEILAIFRRHENTDQDIADALVPEYEKQNEEYKNKIYNLGQQKHKNNLAEEIKVKICSLPRIENAEKVMRYERSIQKSIFQNLLVLKKLQSLP